MRSRSYHWWCAVLLLLSLTAGPGAAVGPGFTFQGQLLDNNLPRNGLCDFQFKLYDAASRGTQIGLTELQPAVQVANGIFTVVLNANAQFGANAFSGGERWVEVAVRCPASIGSFSAPFTPRQPLTAVPYALYAPPQPPAAPGVRFTDNGDGTVTDHSTGLMWEKKTGTFGSSINCNTTACPDARHVNNTYAWCEDSPSNDDCDNPGLYDDNPPDGPLFSDFLARINGELCDASTCAGLAGYTDWRIPTIAELKTIAPSPPPVLGPNVSSFYWSSTTYASSPTHAMSLFFNGSDTTGSPGKYVSNYARAVRGGL